MSAPALVRRPSALPLTAPQIDVVIPVLDEEATLERSVRRLHRYLSSDFPFTWRITIADNASTDATPAIAARLAEALPGVRPLRLDRKGRGRALRAAWSASDARVVCYMDATSRRTCAGCCRSSPRCCRATPTSPSERASPTAPASSAGPSGS